MRRIFSPASPLWPAAVMAALFAAAVLFRPLLPVDETRYMTVAWEMHLQKGWLSPLTLNFQPYHHKPPMLFWLINLAWWVSGVSRWAGLVPVVLASFAVVLLTGRFVKALMPGSQINAEKVTWLALGSVPFLIYSTLVMFDLLLTVFVLAVLICLLRYAEQRQFRYMLAMGVFIGLGVLTKGPVAYLYVIFPMLLGPLWIRDFARPVAWYGDCLAAILISTLPVVVWLLPVLARSDHQFAVWLLWEQTAGRVTGDFHAAHVRPFYFYLPLLPVLLAPWGFIPSFWPNVRRIDFSERHLRFLVFWVVPVIVSFSVISGKQPHYLLPLLPGVVAFFYTTLRAVETHIIKNIALALVVCIVAGQGIAFHFFLRDYDLRPIAARMQASPGHPWAFVRNYHGETGFLARIEEPIASRQMNDIAEWFDENPDGRAVIRYDAEDNVSGFENLYSQDYRGKKLGIFKKRDRDKNGGQGESLTPDRR